MVAATKRRHFLWSMRDFDICFGCSSLSAFSVQSYAHQVDSVFSWPFVQDFDKIFTMPSKKPSLMTVSEQLARKHKQTPAPSSSSQSSSQPPPPRISRQQRKWDYELKKFDEGVAASMIQIGHCVWTVLISWQPKLVKCTRIQL